MTATYNRSYKHAFFHSIMLASHWSMHIRIGQEAVQLKDREWLQPSSIKISPCCSSEVEFLEIIVLNCPCIVHLSWL